MGICLGWNSGDQANKPKAIHTQWMRRTAEKGFPVESPHPGSMSQGVSPIFDGLSGT
ncbi:hypothetical protein ACRALDRAFT_1076079 [Sodiomyces alcalophilus JCM 7366]|uniref:uncharacterized protein n=1 Tax=Sodiomyces alcalophilus JCM 7366 TaxID=591952 RepID=UPI0039B6646D